MVRMNVIQPTGLSHSEIAGSQGICSYPTLIAAYHVLHRLREPRHPPCALRYFLAVQQHLSAAVAHTFSCILVLNLISKIKDRNLSLRFYSLACVNMSKILLREEWREKSEELIFHFSFFTVHLLEWRITDSNRWPPACKAGALASWANHPNIYYLIVIIFYLKDMTFKY